MIKWLKSNNINLFHGWINIKVIHNIIYPVSKHQVKLHHFSERDTWPGTNIVYSFARIRIAVFGVIQAIAQVPEKSGYIPTC
jgi:hypothetical protein